MVLCCITVKYRVIKLFWNTSSRSYVNEFKTNGLQFWLGLSLANLAEGQTVLAWNRVRAIFLHPVTHAGQCSSTRTLLPQTDRATRYVSRSPVNCYTTVYRNKCTYNRSTTKVVLLLLSDDKDGVTIREYLSAIILAQCGISRCAMLVIQPLPHSSSCFRFSEHSNVSLSCICMPTTVARLLPTHSKSVLTVSFEFFD